MSTEYKVEVEFWNWRGNAHDSITIEGAGAVISGGNRRGKTSRLDAVRAAFDSSGVKASSIKNGTDEARIVAHVYGVDAAGAITIKRKFKRGDDGKIEKTVSVSAPNYDGKKPETFLSDIFGSSIGVDPSKLVAARGPDRLEAVLAALQISVTPKQIATWAPDLGSFAFDPSTHGLKVLRSAHDVLYARRTTANTTAERAKGDAERALAASIARPYDSAIPTETEAGQALSSARVALAGVQAAAKAIADHEARIAKNRKTIADLRTESASNAVDDAQVANVERSLSAAREIASTARTEITDLETRLATARATLSRATQAESEATTTRDRLQRQQQASLDLAARATALESTLAAAAPPPSDGDEFSLDLAVSDAEAALAAARANDNAKELAADAAAKVAAAKIAADAAKRLDVQVRALADDAPRELLKACNGIDGLSVFADDVGIGGVPIETLSGMERWKLCIDVARLVGAKGRMLICDNCETLDDDEIGVMGEYAARDGYTVAMARVTRGEIVLSPIGPAALAAE